MAHLNRQGFQIYFPRYLKRRRHARRIETVAAPLFPRYLFVAIDLNIHRWRSICSTVGVSRLVCNGDDPTPVPEGVVETLRTREDAGGFIKLDCRPRFCAGDRVRVLDGAFSSCLGLFEGMAERERIAILLDLLGRKVRVVLDADLVAAA
jgi:transcriptional antiterminator RfaH